MPCVARQHSMCGPHPGLLLCQRLVEQQRLWAQDALSSAYAQAQACRLCAAAVGAGKACRGAHLDAALEALKSYALRAGLFLCRAAVGLGEGVAPSASTDMIARIVRTPERSRATSYMFGGLHVGSLLGLLVAPALIEQFGWQTVRAPKGLGLRVRVASACFSACAH